MIVSIDPGKDKCGIAVIDEKSSAVELKIISSADFADTLSEIIEQYHIDHIVIGDGTTHKTYVPFILSSHIQHTVVNEKNSTLEARTLYFKDHPPGCLFAFVPQGLLSPSRPIDDYAALVIGMRYLTDKENR